MSTLDFLNKRFKAFDALMFKNFNKYIFTNVELLSRDRIEFSENINSDENFQIVQDNDLTYHGAHYFDDNLICHIDTNNEMNLINWLKKHSVFTYQQPLLEIEPQENLKCCKQRAKSFMTFISERFKNITFNDWIILEADQIRFREHISNNEYFEIIQNNDFTYRGKHYINDDWECGIFSKNALGLLRWLNEYKVIQDKEKENFINIKEKYGDDCLFTAFEVLHKDDPIIKTIENFRKAMLDISKLWKSRYFWEFKIYDNGTIEFHQTLEEIQHYSIWINNQKNGYKIAKVDVPYSVMCDWQENRASLSEIFEIFENELLSNVRSTKVNNLKGLIRNELGQKYLATFREDVDETISGIELFKYLGSKRLSISNIGLVDEKVYTILLKDRFNDVESLELQLTSMQSTFEWLRENDPDLRKITLGTHRYE